MAFSDNTKNIKIFEDIIRMLMGKIEANTPAKKRFLEVAAGRRAPQTKWEFIYTDWEAAGRPDIETWFSSGKANAALVMNRIDGYREKKKPSQRSTSKPLSAAQAKRPRKKKRSAAEIQRNHRLSGYNKLTAKFVQGGSVRPK